MENGLLIGADAALAVGLVDELVPEEGVRARALEVLKTQLQLPQAAFHNTRRMLRADLHVAADRYTQDAYLDDILASWWGEEGRRVLGDLAAKLGGKPAR